MNLRNEAIEQGLTGEEYDRIVSLLGRSPNKVELGIFSAMWSEHCCYKSTRLHLKKLPTKGPRVLQGPGENAGIIDLGEGIALAFKIESHNHPSFIEPIQGAATGVGGILRDIFTMGSRPVAILDSLAFGEPENEKTSFLVHGVVAGISGYGNCMGIPTVGGEVHFDRSYNGNNLVNAMAVGVGPVALLHKGIAKGEGNIVLYLGSKTGRDGIHGATMASQEFGSGNEERRPTVQVGDPFTEKLLLEACLEMMAERLLVGIQDMGAAGIACSTFEMSGRGGSGMTIDVDRVPLRAAGMNAWEIFLSESQERMLLVAEPKFVKRIQEIAARWEIDCAEIGTVTTTGRVVARYHGEEVVNLPVAPITDAAPMYDRPVKVKKPRSASVESSSISTADIEKHFWKIVTSPNCSSRRAIFSQYDHTVGSDTVVKPGGDAAVLRLKGRKDGVAVTVDSNPYYCSADPYLGMQHIVAEAVRNLAVVGARAMAVTNCLNFGNPEEPEIMGEIVESIRGLSDACRFFETPVTGGNVSLYNQTGSKNIRPTPVIGMVGLLPDVAHHGVAGFRDAGQAVLLLGAEGDGRFYESEYARTILGRDDLACPPIELSIEKALADLLVRGISEALFLSAHDCSEGGLIMSLAEACLESQSSGVGAKLAIPSHENIAATLFSEIASRAIVSCRNEDLDRIGNLAKQSGVSVTLLGTTGGNALEIEGILHVDLTTLRKKSEEFMEKM